MQACDPATYYLQQVSRATSMKTLDDNGCVTSCGIENGFSPATNVYGCSGCVRTCKTGQNCFLVKKVSIKIGLEQREYLKLRTEVIF